MAYAYFLPSKNVKVFPASYRGNNFDPGARLITEQAYRTIPGLAPNGEKSFVIQFPSVEEGKVKRCILSIEGYIFELTDLHTVFDNATDVAFRIRLQQVNMADNYSTEFLASWRAGTGGVNSTPIDELLTPVHNGGGKEDYYFTGLTLVTNSTNLPYFVQSQNVETEGLLTKDWVNINEILDEGTKDPVYKEITFTVKLGGNRQDNKLVSSLDKRVSDAEKVNSSQDQTLDDHEERVQTLEAKASTLSGVFDKPHKVSALKEFLYGWLQMDTTGPGSTCNFTGSFTFTQEGKDTGLLQAWNSGNNNAIYEGGTTITVHLETYYGGKDYALLKFCCYAPQQVYYATVNNPNQKYTWDGLIWSNLQQVAFKADIPKKVSAFENDKGYLTKHQDLSSYAKKSDIPSPPDLTSYAKKSDLTDYAKRDAPNTFTKNNLFEARAKSLYPGELTDPQFRNITVYESAPDDSELSGFTQGDLIFVEGEIQGGGSNYTHPEFPDQATLGLYKIKVSGGHVETTVPPTTDDLKNLIPEATSTTLGGVKTWNTARETDEITTGWVDNNTYVPTLGAVSAFVDSKAYSLPPATKDALGGVKIWTSSNYNGIGSWCDNNDYVPTMGAVYNLVSDMTCLIEGTQITLYNGTYKNIEDIQPGDIVLSYNPVTQKTVPAVAIRSLLTGASRAYKTYCFENGQFVTVFGKHMIYDQRTGTIGDIQNINDNTKVVVADGSVTHWTLTCPSVCAGKKRKRYSLITSNNLYFANDLLMGDPGYTKLDICLDYNIALSSNIQQVWELDAADYNDYGFSILNNPEFHKERAEMLKVYRKATTELSKNKQLLAQSDYKTHKYTEGKLTEEEWTISNEQREKYRLAVNENEKVLKSNEQERNALWEKYRKLKTPKAIFEACCERDNAIYEQVKAYFTKS